MTAQSAPESLIEAPENAVREDRDDVASAPAPRWRIEGWLEKYCLAAAIAVLAAGFCIRLYVASLGFLDPDEALHYLLIHQKSLWLACKASLTNAHPPLIYVILYFWQSVGRSELVLRLPSVLAGTGFCWVLYKWVEAVFGKAAGLCALILAAFSPSLISLSAQVRAYAVMLLCVAGALYFLERALRARSPRDMAFYAVCLYLAILAHYSVSFLAVALGIYVLARFAQFGFAELRKDWKVVAAWAAGQFGALGIYAFLYVTHVSKIKPGEMQLWSGSVDSALFNPLRGSLAAFTLRETAAIFRFFFLQEHLDQALFAGFVIAAALLLAGKSTVETRGMSPWPLGLLLVLPFGGVWVAALAHRYPYTGGRYLVFLAPVVIGGISLLIAGLSGRRLAPALVLAGLIVAGANASRVRYEPYFIGRNLAHDQMAGATQYVRQSVPPSEPILADMQTGLLLGYYLCGPGDSFPIDPAGPEFLPFSCGGYRVITTNDRTWRFTPATFASRFRDAEAAFGLKPGDSVVVFQAGWGADLDIALSRSDPKYRCLTSTYFGTNITVIHFVVGADGSPSLPPGSPHLSASNQCVNDPSASGATEQAPR